MSDYLENNQQSKNPSRQESRRRRQRWLVIGTVLGSLGLIAGAVVYSNNDDPTRGIRIDHILNGTTTRFGTRIAYAAGIITECRTEGGKPATVQITAHLITQNPDNLTRSDRSGVATAMFKPGAPDCATAVAEAYGDRTTFSGVEQSIIDVVDSVNAESFSTANDATAQKYITEILKAAELKEVPIIQG